MKRMKRTAAAMAATLAISLSVIASPKSPAVAACAVSETDACRRNVPPEAHYRYKFCWHRDSAGRVIWTRYTGDYTESHNAPPICGYPYVLSSGTNPPLPSP